jgi:hypothetical protein
MKARHIAILRFAGWLPVLGCLLLGIDWNASTSIDKPDVVNATSLVRDLTNDGYYCWNDAAPDNYTATVVVTAKVGQEPRTQSTPRAVDRAVEQVLFGVDHGLTVYWFCGLKPVLR